MADRPDELIPTRASLIQRLRCLDDHVSWQDFHDTYRPLIHGVARKSGLTEAEADDVVQETLIAVAKNIPAFRYDAAIGSFKGWLMNMTRWRIADQFRKREQHKFDEQATVSQLEAVQVASPELDKIWQAEWEATLLQAATAKARRRLDPRQYQIFDFCANKGWSAEKVAGMFTISIDQVYLTKHRVTEAIKQEVQRLQKDIV